MKSSLLKAFLAALLVQTILSQSLPGCLNHRGEVVDWFLIYYTPEIIHKNFPLYGYMYTDSTSTNPTLDIYKGWGDQANGPLGLTIAQAEPHKLQTIAWNDQLYPTQGTGNSERAHSKFFMSLKSKSNGFAVVHSTPKYPFLTDQGFFSPREIEPSQKNKAQHFLCMTIRGKETADKILENSCVIKPNIYHNSLGFNCKNTKNQDTFVLQNYNIGKTVFKAVYKNGDKTADIFTDALTDLVESSIVIQTFGSPTAFPPACGSHYTVGNTQEIVIAEGVRWKQISDHSKYAYAIDNDNVCFGDLNRNTRKQTERGGSFYCFESPYLNAALKGINPQHAGC